ncbi:MAG TPA: TRAP transporter small permease [Gammaproteobacteria bacterium]|nr:TRAP transporter small permease [Gammaproteobacteria bacterium]
MSEEPHRSWLERVAALGRAVETTLLAVLLGGLILFASAQILLRNFFSIGVNWGDGLVRLAVFWLALIGALAASRDDRHITMGAFTRWLPAGVQRAAEVLAHSFAGIVCGTFAWLAARFVGQTREFGDTLLNGVPAWWLQAILPFVFALIAYRYFTRAVRRLQGR